MSERNVRRRGVRPSWRIKSRRRDFNDVFTQAESAPPLGAFREDDDVWDELEEIEHLISPYLVILVLGGPERGQGFGRKDKL